MDKLGVIRGVTTKIWLTNDDVAHGGQTAFVVWQMKIEFLKCQ